MVSLEFIGPDRAREISEIAPPLFSEVYDYVPREMLEEFLEETQTAERIREQMAEGMRYAFILDGESRAGYVSYGMDAEGMYLSKLYLFREFRGRGIGGRVIDIVEDEAREAGAPCVHLDVNYRNEGAIRLYRRKGFSEGERIGYMRVIMRKPLRCTSTEEDIDHD